MDRFPNDAVVNTAIAVLAGIAIYIFYVLGKNKSKEGKSREIKATTEHTSPVTKKTGNEKLVTKDVKKTDASVVKVKETKDTFATKEVDSSVDKDIKTNTDAPVDQVDIISTKVTDAPTTLETPDNVNSLSKDLNPSLMQNLTTESSASKVAVCEDSLPKAPRPSLAEFNATEALTTLEARNYINSLPQAPKAPLMEVNTAQVYTSEVNVCQDSLPKASRPSLAQFNATEALTTLEARIYVSSLPQAPKAFPVQAGNTDADISKVNVCQDSLTKAPRPSLAQFNATEAFTTLEARNYVGSLPQIPKPSPMQVSTEANTSEVNVCQDSLPKAPRPSLAQFNATEALVALATRTYISSLPQTLSPAPKQINITEASTSEVKVCQDALPKAPRPSLAQFTATEALTTLAARNYISSLPQAPKPSPKQHTAVETNISKAEVDHESLSAASRPSLAAYNNTVAFTSLKEQLYIKSLPKITKPSVLATISTPCDSEQQSAPLEQLDVKNTRDIVVNKEKSPSNLTSVEATTASQLLKCQAYTKQQQQQDTSDSDIEVEIEDNTPSATASTSTSSLRSETDKFAAIAAASVAAASVAAASAAAAAAAASVPNKEQVLNSQIYGTTWDKLFGENMMSSEPLSMNNTVVFNVNNGKPREWTREEKIRKQSQSHMPKMRNRCDYWPACTNKNCKFSHPTSPCRVGDDCPFGKRCSFIHPKDLLEPTKKRSNSTGTPKRNSTGPLKRANSTGGALRSRKSTVVLK